jgi:hypothetical protein
VAPAIELQHGIEIGDAERACERGDRFLVQGTGIVLAEGFQAVLRAPGQPPVERPSRARNAEASNPGRCALAGV